MVSLQVLTIVTTIFIPLSFIVSVYGMNFQNMPELTWYNGLLRIACLMAAVAVAMLVYFRKSGSSRKFETNSEPIQIKFV